VHLLLRGLGRHSPWPVDGYSPPYQLAAAGTTLALALLTLVLLYRIGRRFSGPTAAAAAAALLTLATPIVAYGAVDVCMAHGPATAFLVLFVFVWLRTFGSTNPGRWLGVGCLLGMVSLMRWQLSTFAILPALEALGLAIYAERWQARIGIAVRLALAGLMAVIVFIPQLVVKQIVYGHPLGDLHPTAHNWLTPSLWTVLGSTDRSLCYWNPITLPALAGVLYASFRSRHPAMRILTLAIAVQIYTVSALFGCGVYLGWSFGFRMLTETCALMVPGIAVLFDRASPRSARRLAISGGLLVGWNLLLLGGFRCAVAEVMGDNAFTVFAVAARYIKIQRLEALAMLTVTAWLTYHLVDAFQSNRIPEVCVFPEEDVSRAA